MTTKQSIFLALAILFLVSMFPFIIFGENGLADLNLLREERDDIIEKNEMLTKENLAKYREIDRLKDDPKYIEDVARDELGMVKEGEVIIKQKR
ncbi:MAG: septum formation initiator family protein [Desulfobacterales bacterium]